MAFASATPRISSTCLVGFRLDLVQVAHTIAANSGGLAVTFRQEAFRDLPAFADHSIINLGPDAFIVVDPLEPDIEQFDTEHADLLGGRRKYLLLDQLAPFLDRHQRPDILLAFRLGQQRIAQRHAILGGADDLDQLMLGDSVAGFAAQNIVEAGLGAAFIAQPQEVLQRIVIRQRAKRSTEM